MARAEKTNQSKKNRNLLSNITKNLNIVTQKSFGTTPEILQIILLDEIASILAHINKLSIPEGRIDPYELTIDDKGKSIFSERGVFWYSITIINDSDVSLYFSTNLGTNKVGKIKPYESARIEPNKKVLYHLYLRAEEGKEANVRIFCLR
ncbi:MAG TPA: hypothetical protein ENG63_10125 [Candidatus Desulfofervidus auxilii]|uniref:Uncharacterized protein n=1 Tax=Desulfofervidus auxilii TaxID=1621989 RepID=A0A7C0Y5Y5_DESA2|nr:hypothetical protein [Candidatus Desulfofervidus auxilii]